MGRGVVLPLLGACHPGPVAAVTVLATALAGSADLPPGRTALLAAAVLAGQLSIGWSNDLVDRHRDRLVGRPDKPLATGGLSVGLVRTACASSVVAVVVLSLLCGPLAGLLHLGLVAAGWAYNLGVKATAWSWLPYAVAFGGLPVFVALAGAPGTALPPAWLPAAAALLGVGAHLVNVLPDLEDDAATGVRGLPHRLGARRTQVAAAAVLVAASALAILAVPDVAWALRLPGLAVVLALGGLALRGRGRTPFRAAIALALLDALLLLAG